MLWFQLYSHVTTIIFFREDEAISLFFKNSSMSCKKLNNIWYCRLLFWKSRTSQKKIYLNFLDQQLSKDCDCYKSFCQTTSVFLSFIVFLWYVLFIISPIWTKLFSFICNLAAHSQLWATVKGSLTSLRLISVLLVSTRRSQGAL